MSVHIGIAAANLVIHHKLAPVRLRKRIEHLKIIVGRTRPAVEQYQRLFNACFFTNNSVVRFVPVKRHIPFRDFHDTSELLCKARLLDAETLEAGQQGFAQLLFDQPLAVRNGDHFILRFFSPTVTIGGGVLLDVDAALHKRRSSAVLDNLRARASGSPDEVVLRVLEKGTAPKHKELAQACALTEEELDAVLSPILERGTVLKLGQRYLLLSSVEALWNYTREMLKAYHQQYPLQVGMNLNEMRSRLGSKSPVYITDDLISCFTRDGRLRLENSVVALPDFEAAYTPESAAIRAQVLALYDGYGLQPDTAEHAEAALGVDPKVLSHGC